MKDRVVIVIGVGHHARRIYVPELLEHKKLEETKIVLVDLEASRERVADYIQDSHQPERLIPYFVQDQDEPDFDNTPLSEELLSKYDILGVIIATDPLHHITYARWGLKNGLHVLSDKPISTHLNVAHDEQAAKQLYADFVELMDLYRGSSSMFCVSTQRRYETGYSFAQQLVGEVRERFGMPITSIQAFYSDGLWIFPDEVMNQRVHPFNEGYGMLSHSAFHILDAVWSFYLEGSTADKMPNSIETFAGATYPDGLVRNFGSADYASAFGKPVTKYDDAYYLQNMQGFGEMDVTANHVLKQDDVPISTFTINMFHNSFSRRSWEVSAPDLYKGNGRVKHQCYIIEQGPFQSIQIHNYQAVSNHDKLDDHDPHDLGGKNHFDIHVFRNAALFGSEEEAVRKYSSAELDELYKQNATKLSNEIAKSIMIDEFVDNCLALKAGEKTRDTVEARNKLESYEVAVKMMSDLYLSLARRNKKQNPLIETTL